jgi:hypothetical protein
MSAQLVHLERRLPLAMTHLEATRFVAQPSVPKTNEW